MPSLETRVRRRHERSLKEDSEMGSSSFGAFGAPVSSPFNAGGGGGGGGGRGGGGFSAFSSSSSQENAQQQSPIYFEIGNPLPVIFLLVFISYVLFQHYGVKHPLTCGFFGFLACFGLLAHHYLTLEST